MKRSLHRTLIAVLLICLVGISAAGYQRAVERAAILRQTQPPVATTQTTPDTLTQVTPATTTPTTNTSTTTTKPATRPADPPVSRDERKPLSGKTIFVDPGHGIAGSGAGGNNGGDEARNNLATALILRDMLVAGGAKVSITRTTNVNPTIPGVTTDQLAARTTMSNRSGADMFISLHENWSDSADARGLQVYYKSGSSASAKLAESIRSATVASTGWRDWGTFAGTYYVLRNSTRPAAVLVECGFISNATDEELLGTSSFQRRIASGVYNGVVAYFKNN